MIDVIVPPRVAARVNVKVKVVRATFATRRMQRVERARPLSLIDVAAADARFLISRQGRAKPEMNPMMKAAPRPSAETRLNEREQGVRLLVSGLGRCEIWVHVP